MENNMNENRPDQKTETAAYNPATGEEIGRFSQHSINDLKNIIDQARLAQSEWQRLSINKRIQTVGKIGRYIYNHADELAHIISVDNGKTQTDAMATEVLPVVMSVDYYCKNSKRFLDDKKISSSNIFFINKRSKIIRCPWGVIGIISPWNYPFSIPFLEVIPALLAGNAVLLKTASETQLVGRAIEDSIAAAVLPRGLFQHINMPGRLIGDALLETGIDKLFFTGSENIGKKLAAKAAETLTPVSLELGGKDPMIICADADLQRAVGGILWAGFQNCGQSCGGIERIYVHHSVYDDFLTLLKPAIESLRLNIGTDPDSDYGAMTTSGQIAVIENQINTAVKSGAIIYAQSNLPMDKNLKNFIPAMVLTNVNHDMEIMREETFGPLVGVMKYQTIDEAIRLANDSRYGLTASVWSSDRKKAEQIGRQLQAGVITINDHLMSHGMPETPWGGFKYSGIGRCHGKLGFDEMTQPQVVVQDLLSFAKKNPWWHPYNQKVYQGIRGALEFLYDSRLITRISGLVKFLKLVPSMFSRGNN